MSNAYFKLKYAREKQRAAWKNLPPTRADGLTDEERDEFYKILLSDDNKEPDQEKPIEEQD